MVSSTGINLSAARACFTRCMGCYNHFGDSPQLLATDVILRFLGIARERGISRLTLCGGDPLARPDIERLLTEAHNLGFLINLDTVGTPLLGDADTVFFGRQRVARLSPYVIAERVNMIGIPLDGATDATIATFREGRADLLNELVASLDILGQAGARVCVNTVVTRQNAHDLARIGALVFARDFVLKWQLFQYSPTGPLGYRMRHRLEIADDRFGEAAVRVREAADSSNWRGSIEVKSNASRRGKYLLVDANGAVWVPRAEVELEAESGAQRIVIGDLRRPQDWGRILEYALTPPNRRASVLAPGLTGRSSVTVPGRGPDGVA